MGSHRCRLQLLDEPESQDLQAGQNAMTHEVRLLHAKFVRLVARLPDNSIDTSKLAFLHSMVLAESEACRSVNMG